MPTSNLSKRMSKGDGRKAMSKDWIRVYNQDCLIGMQDIPDKSIDMILCDLPYGTTACKWDAVIPFEPLWEQYNRIVKDNSAIVLFGSEPFSTMLRGSNLKMYKYDWVWDKVVPFGFLDCKYRPLKSHEIISVFSKGGCSNGSKIPTKYYPQNLIYRMEKKKNRLKSELLHSNPRKDEYVSVATNYPKTILQFKKDKRSLHPTQKPVALLEYLIKTYTNEGDTVLDNCMGSGSTGVACVNTGRRFVGFELDTKYFEIAKRRIDDTTTRLSTNALSENT